MYGLTNGTKSIPVDNIVKAKDKGQGTKRSMEGGIEVETKEEKGKEHREKKKNKIRQRKDDKQTARVKNNR